MKATSNRIMAFALSLCALAVLTSSWLGQTHGQETVPKPTGINQIETLPDRADSAPIIYGNQTPFGMLGDSAKPVEPSSVLTESPDQAAVQTQTVRRQTYDLLPGGQQEGVLPSRPVQDSSSLELIEPLPGNGNISAPTTASPLQGIPGPLSTAPTVRPGVPVAALDVTASHANGCNICGSKTCTICCQPKCITQTIMVPRYHTVWSSIFETRYRTEIKEEAYTVEQEVEHQVPRIIQETVMVPEPRIRTFQDFREVEEQYPVEEPYSVMVRKPRQRMVPVEREETYRYPEEQEYTVMEPREKIVTETKYKVITDKEPRQKKYTVEVDRKRERMVVDYVDKEYEITTREPYKEVVEIPRTRTEWVYENVTVKRMVSEPYFDYEEQIKRSPTKRERVSEDTRPIDVPEVRYVQDKRSFDTTDVKQVAKPDQIEQTYTVAVPEVVYAYENYTISEPYFEDVVVPLKTRKQVEREVTRTYDVKIPYIENIPRQYKVKVPVQVMKKGKRTIPKQIPRTRYQTVKRDEGRWVTTVATIPTYEIESDRCGCSTCCPKTRTVRKTVWQPNIVLSRIPYTVFETVKQEVPYEYPVLEHRFEIRDRMEPVTRYRTEKREVKLTEYDFQPATETKTVQVRRFRQVNERRRIPIQKFRIEERTRMVDIDKYENVTETVKKPFDVEKPQIVNVPGEETYSKRITVDGEQETKVLVPVEKTRQKEVSFVVRQPKPVSVPYVEKVTMTRNRNVTKMIKVRVPDPRIEEFTEKVPEIRTRIEYVDVEKRVPYVETKKITEMVPVKKTRTVYKTDVRTVAELKPEIYFEDVEETFTRTVYKKKIRNVPVNRAEIYWVKVPKVLKKTIFKPVKKKIKRPALRRVPVRVPYQVEVRIPRRVCTMVPHTITIPVEECCEHCIWHLPGVAHATNAWLEYSSVEAAKIFWWIRDE